MTFLEAAIEVLRDSDEALHFSAIAQAAVERELLSHVGRDPEAAMRTCLTSALRGNPPDAVLVRVKPGVYAIKEGAELPPPVAPPKKRASKAKSKAKAKAKSKTKAKAASKSKSKAKAKASSKAEPEVKKTRSRRKAKPADETPAETEAEAGAGEQAPDAERSGEVTFEAPEGSGLEGPTDVALVMANAMSRIVDERPELRSEFDAMQTRPVATEEPKVERRTERGRTREDRDFGNERGGRRRRRRRKRGRKVDWGDNAQPKATATDTLLDATAEVLGEAGARSLHVRQVAEQLSSKGLLGGDISELERSVTAAILVDIGRHGQASRFVARGEARYEFRGARLPEDAAKAEQALYAAVQAVERTTRVNLLGWLRSLGARAFEAVTRMYLEHERFGSVTGLAPARGYGRLTAEDPEAEERGRCLVLSVPAKTQVDREMLDDEAAAQADSVLLVCAGEAPDNLPSRTRTISGEELAAWMIENHVGVRRIDASVQVLDPVLIESVGGLDS